MSNDAILVLKCIFQNIWLIFTSWYIPGTNVTPASFFMFIAVCGLAFRFIYRIIGITPGSIEDASAYIGSQISDRRSDL